MSVNLPIERRVQQLENELRAVRALLESMQQREARRTNRQGIALIKTTGTGLGSGESYPTSGNTLPAVFVDGSFVEEDGQQTPTYVEHSAGYQAYVFSLAGWLAADTYCIAAQIGRQWWVIAAGLALYRFTLNEAWSSGAAEADIAHLNGDPTGVTADVLDPLGEFEDLTTGDQGYAIYQGGQYVAIQAPCGIPA